MYRNTLGKCWTCCGHWDVASFKPKEAKSLFTSPQVIAACRRLCEACNCTATVMLQQGNLRGAHDLLKRTELSFCQSVLVFRAGTPRANSVTGLTGFLPCCEDCGKVLVTNFKPISREMIEKLPPKIQHMCDYPPQQSPSPKPHDMN